MDKRDVQIDNLLKENRNLAFKLGKCGKKIAELKKELCIKDDLIQQLKIALDTDDYKKHREYREKFIGVCEELKDMNCDYANLKKENDELKEAIIGKIQYGEDLEKFAVEKGLIKEDWARFDDYD